LALIGAAAARFVRTGQRLDDEETHPAGSLRAELILSAVLGVVGSAPARAGVTKFEVAPERRRFRRRGARDARPKR
jgi:hypothetical protein